MENSKNTRKAARSIKAYIGQFGALFTVFMWISALAAAALCALGLYYASNTESFNSTYSKEQSYAFVDAVAISDWVYKYQQGGDTQVYYTVADPDNYLYIVSMEPDELSKLQPQNDRWNSEDTDAPAVAHRLFGTVREFTPVVVDDLAQVWDRADSDDFVKYFGDRYLEVNSASSRGKHFPLLLGGSFFGLVFIGLLLSSLPAVLRTKSAVKSLKAAGLLEQAAAELGADDGSADDMGCCVATDNFLFGRGTGVALPYKDILWFYQAGKGTGKKARRKIIANTADRQNITAVELDGASADQVTQRLTSRILGRNPNALYGPGKEMRELYRELCSKRRKEA